MTPDNLDFLRQYITDHECTGGKPELFLYDDATGKRLLPGVTLEGNATIGVGRNIGARGITESLAIGWREDDIIEATTACSQYVWFSNLSDARQIACIDLMYNLGPSGFAQFRNFIAAMARGDFQRAGFEIVNSKLPAARAADNRRLIETGEV